MRHFLVVVVVAASLTLTGSGSVGILGEWSVSQQCTPIAPGDTTGSVGAGKFPAAATSTSVFAIDNDAVLTDPTAGTFRGNVIASPVQGKSVHLDVAGKLNFLVADRTVDPVWFDAGDPLYTAPVGSAAHGTGVGTIATPYDIAIDPFDNSIFVTSYSGIILPGFVFVKKYLVVKYDAAGNYVTQFGGLVTAGVGGGESGSANGYFGGATTVAVSPVDGSVAVGDGVNSRVQIFTPNVGRTLYSYSTKVGTVGTGNGQFGSTTPISVAYDSTGVLFAADSANARIQKFTVSGVTVTYVAQVAVTGFNAVNPIRKLTFSSSNVLYASLLTSVASGAVGTIRSFNTSLVAQNTWTLTAPAGTDSGIKGIVADATGIWASWGQSNFLVHYVLSAGSLVEDNRWYSGFTITPLVFSSYTPAVKTTGEVVVLFPDSAGAEIDTFGPYRVTSFDWAPVPLSDAIENYMRECDGTLGGLSYSYDASSDPDVVLPAWSGDVWSHLKELCTAYDLDIYLDDDTIRVADAGAREITLRNNSPLRIEPTNLFGGQEVIITATNARAGGGIMFNAADTNTRFQIDVGQRRTVIVSTTNYPVSVDAVVPTDSLPILPGQYYVLDSTGAHVPAATWTAAGASVTSAVGGSPGQIGFVLQGPSAAMVGYTGPFTFADSLASTGSAALALTGTGTFTTPQDYSFLTGANPTKTSQQVARTIRNFAISTLEQVAARSPQAIDDVSGIAVTVSFTIPTANLLGFGSTLGATFRTQDSIYRITNVKFGGLTAEVTAVRFVSLDDIDAVTAGLTVDQRDAIWTGYSVDDRSIKPLALAL